MNQELTDYLEKYRTKIEEEMEQRISVLDAPVNLKESMKYSLEAGGKRIRPILLIASFEAYNSNIEKVMSSAVALEMIHTYSLIHDDLPAMDDDDYRRGKLTNHRKFDEATAILAGDALLTNSFQQISDDPLLQPTEKIEIISKLAKSSGPKGMVGGQILDMEAEKRSVSLEELENVHDLKTGELLKFAAYAGAYLAEASEEEIKNLTAFAYYLGLIFQVQDDILDVTGSEEKLGKPVGSDEDKEKSTYPKLLGIEGAIAKKTSYEQKAREALIKANASNSTLDSLLNFVSNRDH